MKRKVLMPCISGLMLASFFSITDQKTFERIANTENFSRDSVWKVTPIAKLGDQAPGTGHTFLDFGSYHLFESGDFIFWAQFGGDKKNKYWGLYSYKKGKPELILVEGVSSSRPNGISQEVGYIERTGYNKFHYTGTGYYISYVSGEKNRDAYIDMWNGNKLVSVLKKGDKVTLSDGRSAVIDYAVVVSATNNNQVVIYFTSDSPAKISGWLFHDGVVLKPMFLQKESLPGMSGIKISNFYGWPFIFNDTLLITMEVEDAPYKRALFRLTKNKTEKIFSQDDAIQLLSDKKVKTISVFNVLEANKFLVIADETLLLYDHGQWKVIVENIKSLPENKGFEKYNIDWTVFIGQKKDSILLSVSLVNEEGFIPNTYVAGRLPLLLLYDGNTLLSIPWYTDVAGVNLLKEFNPKKNIFKPIVISKIPGLSDLIIKIPYEVADKKNIPQDFSLGNYLLDPSDKDLKLRKITQLKTDGTNSFTPASIIGWIDSKRIVAKTGTSEFISGFYELSLH